MIRSHQIRRSAEGEACAVCAARGTTVWAHSNQHCHGKGIAIKAHDIFGAYLCHRCHDQYDNGLTSQHLFHVAMAVSQLRLIEKGIITIKGVEPSDAACKKLPR